MTTFEQLRPTLIGRFSMNVLDDMRRVGQIHVCGAAVSVEELEWPGQGNDRRDVLWRARLGSILEREPPAGVRSVLIEQRELAPGVLGALYHASEQNSKILAWAALLGTGPVPVWFQVKGYEGISQRMVPSLLEVVQAYRVRPEASAGLPEPGLFHLERGAVALPFRGKEEANVCFEASALDVRLEVTTESIDKVKPPGLIARFARAIATFPGARPPVEEVRSGPRTVAGLDGEELVLRSTDKAPVRVMFDWLFLGEEWSGARPKVMLHMESSEDDLDAKLGVWARMLNSLRTTEG